MKHGAGHNRGEGWLIAAGIACVALLCLFMHLDSRPETVRPERISDLSIAVFATPEPAPLDINSAAAEELAGLPGIGAELAGRIVKYRAEHGAFASVDGLDEVPGIGEGKIAGIRELVICG